MQFDYKVVKNNSLGATFVFSPLSNYHHCGYISWKVRFSHPQQISYYIVFLFNSLKIENVF